MIHRMVIIGCGLIGGSLAALVREKTPDTYIIGVDPCSDTRDQARRRGLVHHTVPTMEDAMDDAVDAVVIAVPMGAVISTIQRLTDYVQRSVTVIELSSVKSLLDHEVVRTTHHQVVAVHPMGGRDTVGVAHAHADVLRDRPLIVFSQHALNTVFQSWSFRLVQCPSYQIHDEWMAYVSHGPYALAMIIPLILSGLPEDVSHQLSAISAGGFFDTTRVANSAVDWGRDVLLKNKSVMQPFLTAAIHEMKRLQSWMATDEADALHEGLDRAKCVRNIVANVRESSG